MYHEIPHKHTQSINIPGKIKTEQNSLLSMRFVPPPNSPPSLWKMRLNNRVGIKPRTYTTTYITAAAPEFKK